MKRRDFARKTAAGAAAGVLLAGCARDEAAGPAVQTSPSVTWRLASSFPRGLDTIFGAAEILSSRVSEMTDGRFRIRVYPAGELVPGLQVMDAVQQGTVQAGHTASYYFKGKNPALEFDTGIPFGLTARQQTAWLLEGAGLDLIREVYDDFNIISFLGGNTGAQMGGWFRREINSLRDLRGLRMRIPGLGGEVMDRLGVSVQLISGGEIYTALERGAIDATEWVGPYDDERLGFHRIARYYYYPGWWEPGPALSFLVNKTAWSRLPSPYQAAFASASAEAHRYMVAKYDRENGPALDRLIQQGTQLRRFTDDVMDAAHDATEEIMHQQADRDAMFGRIYASWRQARDQMHRWFSVAELPFAAYTFPLSASEGYIAGEVLTDR